jgi:hypothetical protein
MSKALRGLRHARRSRRLHHVRRSSGDRPRPVLPRPAFPCQEVTITSPVAGQAPPRAVRALSRAGRLLAPAAAAVLVAATAIVVTVAGQGGPQGGPSPPPGPQLTSAPSPPPPPALAIDVVEAGCVIFVVKNVSNYVVLQADDKPVPMGATLLFNEVPLYVQISRRSCAYVYVHGQLRAAAPAGSSWAFAVAR